MTTSLIIKLNESLHKDFKRTAADNEESMVSVVTDCIQKYLASKKKELIH